MPSRAKIAEWEMLLPSEVQISASEITLRNILVMFQKWHQLKKKESGYRIEMANNLLQKSGLLALIINPNLTTS